MLRIVLLGCLVAGGLADKLPLGAEHRSLGPQHGGTSSVSSSSSSAGGSLGNGGFSSASFSSDGASFRASAGNGNFGGNGASFNGGVRFNGNDAGFNGNGGANFRAGAGNNNFNNGASFNGNSGANFNGNAGSNGFSSNNGQFNGQFNSAGGAGGGAFDDGIYRPDEVNGQFDDGTWKPQLYSGDDGLYKDEQYAPNTDASYQFQFDVGDHGRDEAADKDGEVQGSFYAVHPDGLRRDVEFSAGREGFVVTRDESVQGPVPEYALRQAEKPRKIYPPAEIKTSLSPDGIYHWEYDAGDSARSEDINLNTNYYEGDFSFTADDDQNRYAVRYKAGAGIGFVPEGDHLPMQVQETPEVAQAKAAFLEKFEEAQAEALARRGNGFQQANNGNGFQANNGNGFRAQANNGNGFRAQNNNGNGFQRPQGNNGNGFQNNGNGFQRAQTNNGNGYQSPQANNGNGFRAQNNNNGNSFQRAQTNNGNSFQSSSVSAGSQGQQQFGFQQEPFGASSQTRYSSAAAPQADSAVHPSQMVNGLALGGHMRTAPEAAASQISDTYLPPNN